MNGREARLAWIITGIATGILVAALAGGYFWLAEDPFELTVAHSTTPANAEPPLPVPATCEIRLARARLLAREGKLHEAQALLEAGDPDARHAAAFDELRPAVVGAPGPGLAADDDSRQRSWCGDGYPA